MTDPLLATILVLVLAATLGGLIRLARGPTAADRVMSVQLLGTAGVAVVIVLAVLLRAGVLIDLALVFVLLAAVTAITFVRTGGEGEASADEGRHRA